ncbi:MAG: hypothetical protein IPO15_18540 [Anaerolineae bacterium]|uniref:hypothetical protein n=1 Tax=Candidatus Amarolinea dominans TaxID=3140696 RepID=UPI003135A216|nr:hypothetical protein [Anaerolineae bacterium]
MTALTQDDVLETALELYEQEAYAEAYAFVTAEVQQQGLESGQIYNFRICLANLSGQSDLALRLFAEALAQGYWSNPDQMLADEDLLTLRDHVEFLRLLDICRGQQAAAQRTAQPELRLMWPVTTPAPLLVALHGNQHNAADTAPAWEPLTAAGWCVALPQSSQMAGPNAFVWNDLALATAEMRTHAETLRQHPRVDFSRCVVAGFSMGARQALWSVLEGIFPGARADPARPLVARIIGLGATAAAPRGDRHAHVRHHRRRRSIVPASRPSAYRRAAGPQPPL